MLNLLIAVLVIIVLVGLGSVLFVQAMTDEEREDWGHGPKGQGR